MHGRHHVMKLNSINRADLLFKSSRKKRSREKLLKCKQDKIKS